MIFHKTIEGIMRHAMSVGRDWAIHVCLKQRQAKSYQIRGYYIYLTFKSVEGKQTYCFSNGH